MRYDPATPGAHRQSPSSHVHKKTQLSCRTQLVLPCAGCCLYLQLAPGVVGWQLCACACLLLAVSQFSQPCLWIEPGCDNARSPHLLQQQGQQERPLTLNPPFKARSCGYNGHRREAGGRRSCWAGGVLLAASVLRDCSRGNCSSRRHNRPSTGCLSSCCLLLTGSRALMQILITLVHACQGLMSNTVKA